MAQASSVEKYTIKHVKDTGSAVEIPVYPSSITCSDNLISKSWNNMYGEFKDIPVNLKMKINWIFDCQDEDTLKAWYNEKIRKKIIEHKSRFFTLNAYFDGVGFIVGTFYLGTPNTFNSLGGHKNNGEVSHSKYELHWIEVNGVRLNSPTQTTPM
jgi:hypothetical protein